MKSQGNLIKIFVHFLIFTEETFHKNKPNVFNGEKSSLVLFKPYKS